MSLFLSICQSVRQSNHPSIMHYISGTIHHVIIIYGKHLWNDDISRCFFHFCKILIFQAFRRVNGQKIAQNEKQQLHPLRAISKEQYSISLWFLVHLCKMMISPYVFLQFFKISIFGVVRGLKGQKMVQNDKKFCPSHSISQKPYIIRLSFMVHLCKMIISPGAFFIFSSFWFFGLLGSVRAKNCPKWQNILSVALNISGTIHHMIVIYGTDV